MGIVANRRLSTRIPFRKRVKFGSSKPTFVGFTFNLSEGGVGIKADRVFHPLSRIILHIYMEDEIARLEGVVVWVSPTLPGIISSMGLKFSSRADDIKRIYQQRISH